MAFFFMLKSFAWQLDSYQAAALTQIGEMNHTIVGKNNLLNDKLHFKLFFTIDRVGNILRHDQRFAFIQQENVMGLIIVKN